MQGSSVVFFPFIVQILRNCLILPMMSAELTCNNFINVIKSMSSRERNKIRQEEFINLIIQLPEDFGKEVSADIDVKMDDLMAAISLIRAQVTSNTAEILILKTENVTLRKEKETILAGAAIAKDELVRLEARVSSQEKHINGLEQYLCVNNLEIVGLPPAEEDGAPIEDTLIDIFNSLPDIGKQITPEDIDICHMPSDRKDGKLVAVCKFKSRKSKIDILQAKKSSRRFIYKNHDIVIRQLFAIAAAKKRELDFKFLWTKNGSIFMRENEQLPVIKITSDECISKLAHSRDAADTNN